MQKVISVTNLSKFYLVKVKNEGFIASIKGLVKSEKKVIEAVKNLSFDIHRGEIVGLLGVNGAGKTTILKLLSGIIHPTDGEINVIGYNPKERKQDYLKKISFVMGNKRELNWDLPAIDTFNYQRVIYDIPQKQYKENLTELVVMLEVEGKLHIPLRRLSLGERMKMELINNFLYSPEIVFLDEPTLGLDLKSQEIIRNFIKDYCKEHNATIIITSHYMDDIEETCEKILLIDKGEKVFFGQLSELKNESSSFKDVIRKLMEVKDA